MIVVTTEQGKVECGTGRFYTDEHNNLCIEDSDERLIHVFHASTWDEVGWDGDTS